MDMSAPDFRALSRQLKEAGRHDLQKQLSKAITASVKPLKGEFQASALQRLPRSGGLAARVARSRFSTRKNANGVRLVARNQYALEQIDKGQVRHKTYGRAPWHTQAVTPGTFSRPWEDAAPGIRDDVTAAVEDVMSKIKG